MRLYYELTTLAPVVLSQTTATTNNHQGLDAIPGSAILGLFAKYLYPSVSAEESWDLFHSGKVCFGPAYPMVNGELTLPMPSSWHFPKGKSVHVNQMLSPDLINKATLIDAATHDLDLTMQLKQCREGYITSQGSLAQVLQGSVTKTALDRDTGSAKDASLYTYTFLEKGQRFIGWINVNADQYASIIKDHLNGEHRLGRARGSEFGRVGLRLIDSKVISNPIVSHPSRLVIWCLNDCQCIDSLGRPTLNPELNELHSELSGTLNKELSHIRTRRITLFNQARNGTDSEQVVISRGSVLVFDGDFANSSDAIQQLEQQGIGINKVQGLGWIACNPVWAEKVNLNPSRLFNLTSFEGLNTEKTKLEHDASTPLTQWIDRQVSSISQAKKSDVDASRLLYSIVSVYIAFRSYLNTPKDYAIGPSSSQWRRVEQLLRYDQQDWKKTMFEGERPICPTDFTKKINLDPEGWGVKWQHNGHMMLFSQWLKSELDKEDISAMTMKLCLEKLCRYDISYLDEINRLKDDFSHLWANKETAK